MNHRALIAVLAAVCFLSALGVVAVRVAPWHGPDALPMRPPSAARQSQSVATSLPAPASPSQSPAQMVDAAGHSSPESQAEDNPAANPPPQTYEDERAARIANPLRPARTN